MGERKGTNKYYPPDFDPKIHKSLNGYHGTHALRERARKLDRGILIIRFEMPYNIWCDGCKAHIGMGVRYNAEKTKIGMYFTTPIYQFRMKCHLCDNHFEIKTDPKNQEYVIVSGAKRKEQRWDMADNEQILTEEKSDIKRLNTDPMFKLEHETEDKTKMAKLMPTLTELETSKLQWKDDFNLNSLMRSKLREEKKQINEQKSKDDEFLKRLNIDINLVKENEDDIKIASLYKYYPIKENHNDLQAKRKKIEEESIFNDKPYLSNSNNESKPDKELSKCTSTSSKESKINNLRKKLEKSIQEKKVNELNSSKSLYFDIKKTNEDLLNVGEKQSKLVQTKNSNNSVQKIEANINENVGNKLYRLVSNQYDDDADSLSNDNS